MAANFDVECISYSELPSPDGNIPCLAVMVPTRSQACQVIERWRMVSAGVSAHVHPTGDVSRRSEIEVSFQREKGGYTFTVRTPVSLTKVPGVETELVNRFLSCFQQASFYILTAGYGSRLLLQDEVEGSGIVRNTILIDGKAHHCGSRYGTPPKSPSAKGGGLKGGRKKGKRKLRRKRRSG